ncbi:MAG: helix-turn-helix transcriptional regulator [Pseudomonadota bacterium]
MPDDKPPYLTTREVADLLRVKERKVYDLAAAGEIPHRRITGKLLFPADDLRAWIEGDTGERPAVLTGSHDPLLDWAVRESGAGLATLWNGSEEGLGTFAAGQAALAGLHLPEDDGWNIAAVTARDVGDCVLIAWARRARGLIVTPGCRDITDVADLKGKRIVNRQPGAGTAALMERLLSDAGISAGDVVAATGLARTESDAAAMVASGDADAALGIEAMARRYHLHFVPLIEEQFDLLIDRRSYFTVPVQTLLSFGNTAEFRDKADAMGGYVLDGLGAVRWLSP